MSAPSAAPSGESAMLDEYAVLRDESASLFAVPDIVSPLDGARDAGPVADAGVRVPDAEGARVDDEVALLSSPKGRREWIRRQMLSRQGSFTNVDDLRIFCGTWNVNGRRPSVDLAAWLAVHSSRKHPDVYFLGLQEVQPLSGMGAVTTDAARGDTWKNVVEKALGAPDAYVTIGARQMVGILLLVLVRREHEPFIRSVYSAEAGTGFMRSGGNKGGVACRFSLYDKTVSCVSCHLAAHDHNVERRNQDFHDVVRKMLFYGEGDKTEPSPFSYLQHDEAIAPSSPGSGTGGQTTLLEHDMVFWIGDLNYRIQLPVDDVMNLISLEDWEQLRVHDQLNVARMSGESFQGFEEAELDFAPTYKQDLDGPGYQMKEEEEGLKKTPAWCDRILWRDRIRSSQRSVAVKGSDDFAKGGVKVLAYDRHELLSSDHRPVAAVFQVQFRRMCIEKRNKAVRGIHSDLKKRENLLRPRFSLSATAVSFGHVGYGDSVRAADPVVVINRGRVPIAINITESDLPKWLELDTSVSSPLAFVLAPTEKAELWFRARVVSGSGVSTSLNMGQERLITTARMRVQNETEVVLNFSGQYQRSCFGNYLSHLGIRPAHLPGDEDYDSTKNEVMKGERNGVASSAEESSSSPAATSPGIPAVPKEFVKLVGLLLRNRDVQGHLQTDSMLFKEPADAKHVRTLRDMLDRDMELPEKIPGICVASCLMQLLISLEEPVVPFCCYRACIEVGRNATCEPDELHAAMQDAAALNMNTLTYIVAFLRELPGVRQSIAALSDAPNDRERRSEDNEADAETAGHIDLDGISMVFGSVLLSPPDRDMSAPSADSTTDIEARAGFVRHCILLLGAPPLLMLFDL